MTSALEEPSPGGLNTLRHYRGQIVGGLTNALACLYIVFVNPQILATPETGMPFSGVLTATVLLTVSMTLLMGVYAKLPYVVAPGMGVNLFFAATLVSRQGVPWKVALGMVFWAGVAFLLISMSGVREAIARSIPQSLRIGTGIGIGLFLARLGFGSFGPSGFSMAMWATGLLIIAVLIKMQSPVAMLAGIGGVTAASVAAGEVSVPAHVVSMPDFTSTVFALDPLGALRPEYLPAIFAIMFTDLFDSISTFVGVSKTTGLVDADGEPKGLRKGLVVDAWATLVAGVLGTSSGTAYIESAAGIRSGGRSGLAAVVTALCFLPFLFLADLAKLVPSYATGPVLVTVGILSLSQLTELRRRWEESVPGILSLAVIPTTMSITKGLSAGFLAYAVCFILAGRRKEVGGVLYALAAIGGLMLLGA